MSLECMIQGKMVSDEAVGRGRARVSLGIESQAKEFVSVLFQV